MVYIGLVTVRANQLLSIHSLMVLCSCKVYVSGSSRLRRLSASRPANHKPLLDASLSSSHCLSHEKVMVSSEKLS